MKLPGSRMRRRTFLKESAIAAAGIAAAGAVRVAAAEPLDARRQNGGSVAGGSEAAVRIVALSLHAVHGAAGRHRRLRRSGLGSSARSVARRRRGGHARARPADDAMGRNLCGFLSVARRRRAARARGRRCSTCSGAESSRTRWVPVEFVDLCRQAGAEPLICVNFESDGRKQYVKVQGQRPHGRRQGSGRVGRVLQRSGDRRAQAPRDRGAAGLSATGRSATKPPTTRTASTSKPRRARPSSLPRPCGSRSRDSVDRLGRQRLGGRAWRRSPANTFSISRSITCSIPIRRSQPVLRGELYRRDPDATWDQLMKAWQLADAKIRAVRDSLGGRRASRWR